MKRYLAFYGSCYYPIGGMGDFIGDFDSIEEAINFIQVTYKNDNSKDRITSWGSEWANVYDTMKRIEVWFK